MRILQAPSVMEAARKDSFRLRLAGDGEATSLGEGGRGMPCIAESANLRFVFILILHNITS